jgi:hypothetical protein
MQHHQQYIDKRRSGLINHSNKTTYDDFYTKLERIRLSSSKSSDVKQKIFVFSSIETNYLYKKDDHD